jgi:hypothetical protein
MGTLLSIQNDAENEALLKALPGFFARGGSTIRHLGKDYRVRGDCLRIETYLPVVAVVDPPNDKGACNVTLRVTNLATTPNDGGRTLHPQIRGQVKFSPKSGEPIAYFFLEENPFKAVVGRFKRLLQTGKVTREDLKGILTPRELEAL